MQAKHLAIIAGLVLAALLPLGARGAPGDLGVEEADLGSSIARPRQINVAPDGALLISSDQASEIRRVDPQTGAYMAYTHGSAVVSPIDARADNQGAIWFSDWTTRKVGRISGSALTTWALPSAVAPWGVALDGAGRVWVADAGAEFVYRLQPAQNRVCRYSLPAEPEPGISESIVYSAGKLWLGDFINGRILWVTPLTTLDRIQVESWQVPAAGAKTSYPLGLAVDEGGSLWWADHGLGFLARLEPGLNRMTSFTPPAGTSPVALAFAGDRIWYAEDGQDTIGLLDPSAAAGHTTVLLAGAPQTITPNCQTVMPGQLTITATSGSLSWTAKNWATLAVGGGWTVYQMSLAPQRANPQGIAVLPGYVWVADQGRHLVARFEHGISVTGTPTATPTSTGGPTWPPPTPTSTPTATPTATATPGSGPARPIYLPMALRS